LFILILFYYIRMRGTIDSIIDIKLRMLLCVLHSVPLLISQYFFHSRLQRCGMVLFGSDEGYLIESREESIATALQLEIN